MKKLFLLDAYALIYRAYYALIRNPRINSKKQNTSAIFGFVNTLEEILQKEKPTHIAVAFDPKGGTFRNEVYPEYKAQREETPEDIRFSIPIIKDIIRAYNIEILELPGYEADDVIGTIAVEAAKHGFETYMMTPDKDYGQLVQPNIYIYKPSVGGKPAQKLGVQEICEKYGINSPSQVIDILGLMGDAVDNVPGCPGVGEKTACSLMQSYDSIEQMYADTSKIKGKLREKIEQNKEQVLFSKFLVTIKTDVPIAFDEHKLQFRSSDKEQLRGIFKEMEFYSFLKKLDESNVALPSAKIIPTNAPRQLDLFDAEPDEYAGDVVLSDSRSLDLSNLNVQLIDNEDEQVQKMEKIFVREKVAFELVATGKNPLEAKICGMAVCASMEETFYFPFLPALDKSSKVYPLLRTFFASEATIKICHDIKPQAQMLASLDIRMKGKVFDTMLGHYILQPELKHDLLQLSETYLHSTLPRMESLFAPEVINGGNFSLQDTSALCLYFGGRAQAALALAPMLKEAMQKQGVWSYYKETEVPLAFVLGDMEEKGVRINTESLNETSRLFTARMNEYEAIAYKHSGMEFNISSPKQVGEVLFEHLHLSEKPKKTKTGQYVTSEEVLEALRQNSVVVDNILKYRAMKKLLSTYIDALPKLISARTNHIHSSFNQAVTATGRLSSSDPNLQNIPVRGDDGKEIRKAFIPDEGQLFFSADYSQIELRVMAHLSQDPHMIEAFVEGHDVHAATAAKIFHKSIDDVTAEERRRAKTANFGIMYGISAFGLAQRMGVSRTEAKELIDGYFATYTHIRDYIEQTKEKAKKQGFIETIFHRRRYVPDINSHNAVVRGYAERNAVNAPIQGSASDIIKVAMVRIFLRFLKEKVRSKMILQVHDELNFSVLPEEKDKVGEIVKYEMEHAFELRVPLVADFGWGANWLEAH